MSNRFQSRFNRKPTSSFGLSVGTAPAGYVRTAFISSTGSDGTAVLNDPDLPFNNLNTAAAALYAAYTGFPTTIRLLDNIAGDIGINSIGLLQDGLTIRSHDATRRTLTGLVKLYGAENAGTSDLTLLNVQISEVGELHDPASPESIGTLRADADSIIDLLTLSGSTEGSAGGTGSDGVTHNGNGGSAGSDGDPPTNGGEGEDAISNGAPGIDGGAGSSAWDIAIVSDAGFTITQLNGFGKNGGAGGMGGAGATATGGDGGSGGNALTPDGDGANGGNGGDAAANGGVGGNGGAGGSGSTVTVTGSCTVSSQNLAGGLGGLGGAGGAAGTATAGVGGAGGSGAGSGNPGASGSTGVSEQNNGGTGEDGATGNDGAINFV